MLDWIARFLRSKNASIVLIIFSNNKFLNSILFDLKIHFTYRPTQILENWISFFLITFMFNVKWRKTVLLVSGWEFVQSFQTSITLFQANVMVEYTYQEAKELLERNLSNAKITRQSMIEDASYLKEQITTCEVGLTSLPLSIYLILD